MADVFISYKKERRGHAERLAAVLEANGLDAWWDHELIAGDSYRRQIQEKLDAAKVVVVLWCGASVQSDFVLDEASRAKSMGKLLPVMIEAVQQPIGFGEVQAEDLAAWTGALSDPRLSRVVRAIADKAGASVRPDAAMLAALGALEPIAVAASGAASKIVAKRDARRGARTRMGVLAVALIAAVGGFGVWSVRDRLWAAPQEPAAETDTQTPGAVVDNRQQVRDCGICGEFIVVRAGSYLRGADPGSDPGFEANEAPQVGVRVASFALGVNEVTNAQWSECVRDTACRDLAPRFGDDYPVMGVSREDIDQFLTWLNAQPDVVESGHRYRLPSEAEWEYAARAGTASVYYTGATIAAEAANFDHGRPDFSPARPTQVRGPSPVGTFPANPWGLHDMLGNVWEWTADCYAPTYADAPTDGSAAAGQSCLRGVVRGGSFICAPHSLRVANRVPERTTVRVNDFGFRLARDLN